MIGTRTSSSYTPHVDVAPADRPLILVAPRWEEAKPFLSETLSPNEEIASVFVDAILAAGGLPLQMSITEDIEVIRHYVDIADGIAIPGGPDVNPKRWAMIDPTTPPSAARSAIALSLSWSARCSAPKSRSLPPAAARSCSMSPPAAPCAWTCQAWARARAARSGAIPTCSTTPCIPSRSCRARCWSARLAGTGLSRPTPHTTAASIVWVKARAWSPSNRWRARVHRSRRPTLLPGRAMASRVHLADARNRL